MNNWNKLVKGMILTSVLFIGQGVEAQAVSNASSDKNMQVLETQQADVTGDKTADTVVLYGKKLDNSSPYLDELVVKVTDGKSKKVMTINLNDGGYSPKMSLQDFTGDKAAEIMVSADTGGSGGYTTTHIYSVKNGVTQDLGCPGLGENKAGVLGNGFVALKPITLSQSKLNVLQGTERLIGSTNADTRGYLNSRWQWNHTKWELINADFQAASQPLTVYEDKFTSSDSDFAFMAPKSWNGNVLVQELTGSKADEAMPKAKSVTSFLFNTDNMQDRMPIIEIYAFDKADWNKMNHPEQEPPVGIEIAENAATHTVYVAALLQSNPYDTATLQGKQYDSLYKSLGDVKKAFVLLKR
ncbi:hypothetical protein ACQCN2_19375 [Brevibacillus ginsengisoli]|uniref:hypothetical protein n=1 Tax=Brevibacillus ginsengisoli TaxID=363854 RepID=UPI003CF74358